MSYSDRESIIKEKYESNRFRLKVASALLKWWNQYFSDHGKIPKLFLSGVIDSTEQLQHELVNRRKLPDTRDHMNDTREIFIKIKELRRLISDNRVLLRREKDFVEIKNHLNNLADLDEYVYSQANSLWVLEGVDGISDDRFFEKIHNRVRARVSSSRKKFIDDLAFFYMKYTGRNDLEAISRGPGQKNQYRELAIKCLKFADPKLAKVDDPKAFVFKDLFSEQKTRIEEASKDLPLKKGFISHLLLKLVLDETNR